MPAPQLIKDLVESFKRNEHIYKNPKEYDEENTKTEFINPFFEALGWDVTNKQNKSPLYKDVKFENSIKVGNKTKAPDYAFRIGGQTKFFVEAKKPSVNIETDRNPAYQIRRYGWTSKLDLCILTDFETLAVYDTSVKPEKTQNASIARIAFYHYSEYISKWDEISNIFNKTSIEKGNFDNFVSNHEGIKKGTSTVDEEFLKEIEHWREILAKNIALRNTNLSDDELNYVVQLIIDRIIFLRIAEDRGIERYGTLKKLLDKKDIYSNFCKICQKADKEYNSGLFHFIEEEKADLTVDTLTLDLTIDDKTLKEIFTNLYYPNSPYEFSILPLEILGQVYEQFLGKEIRLTPSHQAKIEEKPEVKKVGGIYYTPPNVTEYIVENTIGKLINGKTPNEISKIKILDPSCGSGSFLLRAYTYLLDYHLNYYIELKKRPSKVIYEKNGNYYLTIKEKKRILTNNIHGVDIDLLAVEVTKLSLLLKVLEDQNKDELEQQRTLYHERALPNLSSNIKCGNSLISTDIYEKEYKDIEKENLKHPFDYKTEFPEVFNNGGFDVIIGNPPFVEHSKIKDMKEYLKDHYELFTGSSDKYVYFFEKSIKILKNNGYLGYICSNKYTKAKYGLPLRKKLSKYNILKYIDCSKEKIFKKAAVLPSIIIINNSFDENNLIEVDSQFSIEQKSLDNNTWSFNPPEILNLRNKILTKSESLKNIDKIEIYRGVLTGFNKAFIINETIKNNLIKEDQQNKEIIKPVLRGRDIKQWKIQDNKLYIIFTRRSTNINKYPLIKEYLTQYKKELTPKKDNKSKQGRKSGKYKWYEIQDTIKYYKDFENPKIIWAEIAPEPSFIIDRENQLILNSAYMLNSDNEMYPLEYLVGLLNSNITKWIFRSISSQILGERLRFTKQYVEQIPIIKTSKNKIKEISNYSINIQKLHKKLDNTKTPQEKKEITQKITRLKKELNNKIYELYDLTPDEIRIIEETVED